VFESSSTNLVTGDSNGVQDIFVYDRQTSSMVNITLSGNGNSYNPAISADGRYVTFYSNATNLVAGDINGRPDIFVYDRQTSSMQNITLSGNGNSYNPAISADGRYITFSSAASNLVAGDINGRPDIFVYDRQTSSMVNITLSGNGNSYSPSMSADGRYVTFNSDADNLVSGDTNGVSDIFLYDRQTDTMESITNGDGDSVYPSISADGRYVTFNSDADNLVSGDTNGVSDIFLYDRQTDTMENITIVGNDPSYSPSMSADGRFVTYSHNSQVYLYENGVEQCDDGNANNDDACSNSCTLNTPSCPAFNFTIAPTTGTVPRPVTGTWSGVA